MRKGRCPVGEPRHEHYVHHGGDYESGEGDPYRHVGSAGKLVPHGNVEEHAKEHVTEEHYRHNAYAHAEITPEEQGNDIYVGYDTHEHQPAEGRKVLHHNGIEFL